VPFEQIAPILQKNCLPCHTSATKMGGLVMESYEALLQGGTHGPAVVPRQSADSRMIQMLEGKIQPRMPFGQDPLKAEDIAAIKAWIDAGAKGAASGVNVVLIAPTPVIPDMKPLVPVVSPVGSIAYSPEGKLLAVGGYKEVRLMNPANGKVLATLGGHAGLVRALAFSPDGKWLAASGGLAQRSGEIRIWDVETHQLLRTMEGHNDCIYSVAVSPDGKTIASGSYDKLIKLWDENSGKETRTLKDHIDAVFAVAFSPDGKWLASGAQDRTVKIWDVASGKRLYTLSDALDGITTIAFHPSGQQIAAAGHDKVIRVWGLSDKGGTQAQSMIADEDSILQIAYSPDGKTIISTSADRSIRFRDSTTLNPMLALENQPDWVDAISISPDGKWLAAGRYDGTVSVYDTASAKQVSGPWVAFELYQPEAKVAKHPAADAAHR
jgi:WD40 repeat protein